MSKYSAPRTNFGPPPPGYVPGLGRGAVGFTTRSDIGPARVEAVEPPPGFPGATVGPTPSSGPPPGFPGGAPSAAANSGGGGAAGGDSEAADYSDATFDEFSGFNERLFGTGAYDDEDKEADLVFDAIDKRMDSKRKERREQLLQQRLMQYRKERPIVGELFRALKRDLNTMQVADWANIPEPLDYSRQNKQRKKEKEKARERATPVPDSALASAPVGNSYSTVLDPKEQLWGGQTPLGTVTPAGGPMDLSTLRAVKDTALMVNLDRLGDNVMGQTVVDPKGYLTDLGAKKVKGDAEVGDIKKAKLLVESLLKTNPHQPEAWLAAARLEAETGKMIKARTIILQGTKACPNSEDVWLEAARLHPPYDASRLLAEAVKKLSLSVKIWLAARDLEQDPEKRKLILRKALDVIPNSVRLWKAAVEQETPEDARILLSRAVECVPDSVEMWLALARLETYENAKVVLNRARMAVPNDPTIWITAAKLEESAGNPNNVEPIIQACLRTMQQNNVHMDRDTWLVEAETAEKAGSKLTCQAIVRATVALGVDELDSKNIWMNDAQTFMSRGSIETARAIFAHMLSVFPSKKPIWVAAAGLERQHGTRESLDTLLEKAVTYCPRAEDLWLMRAKQKWLAGDVAAARSILNNAFAANSESEDIWLAAVKLESENKEYERARLLLGKARESSGTAHVWMKSALLERQLGDRERELRMLEEAIEKFPIYPKLWMMLGHYYLLAPTPDLESARNAYRKGLQHCPTSVDLWLCAVDLEVLYAKNFAKARATLETARLKIPKHPKLWLSAIRIEQRQNNMKVAEQLLAKALQECPNSGILWAHAIASAPRPQRRSKCHDALQRCDNDAHVFVVCAKLFWLDRKVNKARDWFNRAVTMDADLGDAWVFFYKFEQEYGTPEIIEVLVKKCVDAAPRHGELWISVSKDLRNKAALSTEEILKKAAAKVKDHFQLFYD